MRHRVKKIKFKQGKDANKMLIRKMIVNFITNSKIETTINKAKVLKPTVERLVDKAKVENEANKNYLLKILNDSKLVDRTFREIGQSLKDKTGGYVRVVRMGVRPSDGSEMARLEWAYPVVKSERSEKIRSRKVQTSEKSEVGKPR